MKINTKKRGVTNKKETYVKCKKCKTFIPYNTHKKMTACGCGAVEVDGCEYYVRIIGDKKNYEQVLK